MLTVLGSRSKAILQDSQRRTSPVTAKATLLKQDNHLAEEVVPDSEDDTRNVSSPNEVIEISSDEEDSTSGSRSYTLGDNFLPTQGPWAINQKSSDAEGAHESLRQFPMFATPRKLYRAPRMVIESSDEDGDSEENIPRISEVIELSDSSPEGSVLRETELFRKIAAKAPTSSEKQQFDSDREDHSENDDSILVLYEPRSARKPFRLPNLPEASPVSPKQLSDLNYDGGQSPTSYRNINNPKGTCHRPKVPKASMTPAKPLSTAITPGLRNKETPRLSKKAQVAAEQERRVTYARSLFEELNRSVFEDKLPKETKLNWSKRLLTTAGRAKWHRSRDGVQTTEIELAEKILDCDERIRNTLSHEMCHLASWIIDARPKEVHGSIFKTWSKKVMRIYPEISITTKHNYEIDFKFNWKCLQCSKIYGRHSKSIDVAKVVCGACRKGRLTALFETRASRNLRTPKMSDLASAKLQDSPRLLPKTDVSIPLKPNISTDPVLCVIHSSDSEQDAEIETLTTAMGSVIFISSS